MHLWQNVGMPPAATPLTIALIAAQLEEAWEAALLRESRVMSAYGSKRCLSPAPAILAPTARDWLMISRRHGRAPRTTMRTRQRLVRALITEIVAKASMEPAGEIVLVIHWKSGQHSRSCASVKPRTGEHGFAARPEQALAVMRSMAGRWSDQDIAASLNRLGMPTGQSKTWTAKRVSLRCAECMASTATALRR